VVRVLVVDDLPFMREAVREAIHSAQMRCVGEAANGREALELYRTARPDVVVLDITMPEMGGIEALKKLKKYDSQARVIICSAMGQQPLIIEALKAGAEDYIVKPFYKSKIKNTINNVL